MSRPVQIIFGLGTALCIVAYGLPAGVLYVGTCLVLRRINLGRWW